MRTLHILVTALLCFVLSPTLSRAADMPHSADIAKRGLKPSDFPRWKQLVPNVYEYEGLHAPDAQGSIINTVSMIVVTTDGVVVVDGQGDLAQTTAMVDNIKKITPQPIKYVVVASDHIDHVGGNAAFKTAFPRVVFISSPASQKNLAKNENPPTETVADKRVLKVGNTELQVLNLGRAHTGGDLVVYLPESKVLFMSEVYLRDVFPAMRSAYPTEWVATIKKAQAMDVSWYVPGHGFVDDMPTMKKDLDEARKALEYVIAEVKRLRAAGAACVTTANPPVCADADKQANWGPYKDWALSSSQGPMAIGKVYQEIDGKLP